MCYEKGCYRHKVTNIFTLSAGKERAVFILRPFAFCFYRNGIMAVQRGMCRRSNVLFLSCPYLITVVSVLGAVCAYSLYECKKQGGMLLFLLKKCIFAVI